jgi:hypothetical protein
MNAASWLNLTLSAPAARLHAGLAQRLAPTVGAIVNAVVTAEIGGPDEVDAAALAAARALMVKRLLAMPPHMGGGMLALTLLFEQSGLAHGGRPFSRLPVGAQAAMLQGWREAPVPFCRDFVDFYEKMGVFVYWSIIEEAGHHG